MKLLLVNANTTEAVTELVLAEARRCARPETEISAVTATFGVGIVSTEAENVIASHAALDLLAKHHPGHDAAILAISFDSGLAAARQLSPIPVLGLTAAALHTACLLARQVGVIIFGGVSRSLYVQLFDSMGMHRRIAAIEAVELASPQEYLDAGSLDERALDAAARLSRHDGVEAIVICGAAVAGMARRLQPHLAMPVIDGVSAAIGQAELVVGLNVRVRPRVRPLVAGRPTLGLSAAMQVFLEPPG